MGINFAHFNRRENRRLLMIVDHKNTPHLGPDNITILRGTVKNAAASLQNRAVLVHSTNIVAAHIRFQ